MVLLKKAQTEILGLVIIVILISLIGIFVLQLAMHKQPQEIEFKHLEIKANNLRNAILKTTLCQSYTIKDEIEACSYNYNLCLNDCDTLKNKIKELIEFSIEENYNFTISSEDYFLEINKGTCLSKITAVCQPTLQGLNICITLC